MGTQAKGVSTTDDSQAGTPLTKEAMAELLELHRAGQQADRDADAVDYRVMLESIIDRKVAEAARRATQPLASEIGETIVSALRDDKRVRYSIERAVQWGVLKAIIATIVFPALFGAVLAFIGGLLGLFGGG